LLRAVLEHCRRAAKDRNRIVQFHFASRRLLSLNWFILAAALALGVTAPRTASAEALLLVEADTGKVLQAENATYPWHPASVTKLMTTYVTLQAVKQGRINLDTVVTVSPIASAQSPSKMGFKAGTQVTIDNALKMMMVKSANDMAVVLAEGVGGSVDGFSAMMNATAQKLGMTQTHYVNPNGLPADEQVTSARDLAILARAIIRDLPEYEYFVHIPAIKFGRRITPNFNKLIGRYPGADGMKTGFICASGYNLVATATRGNKRLIAVVLGASSGQARAVKAAQLLERGFNTGTGGLTWLQPALGTVDALAPIDAAPPNLRDEMCGPKRKRPASDADDEVVASNEASSQAMSFFTAGLQPPTLRPVDMIAAAAAPVEPVIVYIGPKKTGADLIAANAVEEARQTPKPKGKKGTKTAAKKPDAAADSKDAKPAAKPAAKQAAVKPDAAAPKPAAAAKPAAAKPAAAKPATAASAVPATTPAKPKAAAKPAPKATTGEAKPAAAAPRT
jgi:D-alanyl-D-alanine carboxypeptidase